MRSVNRGWPARVWLWVVLAIAASQVLLGLLGAAAGGVAPGGMSSPIPLWIDLIQVLVFGGAATWLLLGGWRDARAIALSGVFLVTAAAFSGRLAAGLSERLPAIPAGGLEALVAVRVDAFLPFFFWSFAERFPRARPFGRSARAAKLMVRLALSAALVLVAVSLVETLVPSRAVPLALAPLVKLFSRTGAGGYSIVLSTLTLGALLFIVWKSRHARLEEQRRARLFIAALVLGLGPLFLEVLLHSTLPPFARFMERPTSMLVGGLIFYPLLLSIPFTTAYSVLVHQVLDVRLVVRKAIRYATARYSLAALAAAPFAALAVYVYLHRDQPIAHVLSGSGTAVVVLLALPGIVALRLRPRILHALDRRFFREQYDARQILSTLARSIRRAETPGDWAGQLAAEIDRALHLHSHDILLFDRFGGTYRSALPTGARELPGDAPLAELATETPEPVVLDLGRDSPLFERLPERDLQWLADGGFEVLVPILGSDRSPLGIVALGEKKSELPFTREDLTLLSAIAESAAVPLEYRLPAAAEVDSGVWAAPGPGEIDRPARECSPCGALHPAATSVCPICGGELTEARAPILLAGKYRLERRLGAGGMGVVYRGRDEGLDRAVAIKTLPRMSAQRAMRMRREARAMAAVAHPNLAAIYAVESWRGTPFLILELLEGGTLDERIADRPLPAPEVIALGADLAAALERIHAAGILHRDLKPSNIGFTIGGTPKLLDFGLARILADAAPEVPPNGSRTVGPGTVILPDSETITHLGTTRAGAIVGTPFYMSPEALAREPPDPSVDLWSLAVVLWEATAGRHPFTSENGRVALSGPLDQRFPPRDGLPPDCPAGLSELLERALSPNRKRRPQSARDFKARLLGVR